MKKITIAVLACAALLAGCQSMQQSDSKSGQKAEAAAPKADTLGPTVQTALKSDENLKKFDIKATGGDDGKVTLTGKVDNDFQVWHSGEVAKKVSGVKSVDNKVKAE